ncbi:MAG: DUF3301 domain-containing protein [Pontibacterium sp.]
MYIELQDLFWLSLISLLCLHWWHSLKIKETALKHTRRHCKEMDLQLLDDSIGLRALWLKRDTGGRLRFWRTYVFEFTATGDDRYQGRIILLGRKITDIQLEPHRI